jgi:hypothetical protein
VHISLHFRAVNRSEHTGQYELAFSVTGAVICTDGAAIGAFSSMNLTARSL